MNKNMNIYYIAIVPQINTVGNKYSEYSILPLN